MTLIQDNFSGGTLTGLGPNWTLGRGGTSEGSGWLRNSTGQAYTGSSDTLIATHNTPPGGTDQFAEITLGSTGASMGVLVCATAPTGAQDTAVGGYLARHNGNSVVIAKLAQAVIASTALVTATHTRVAGQKLRLVRSGTDLVAYIDRVEVARATDTDRSGGLVGMRAGGTGGATADDFAAGNMADMATLDGGTAPGGGGTTPPPTTTTPTPTSSAAWRGLVISPAGELILAGEVCHRIVADMWGLGPYTPPATLTSPSGTLELASGGGGVLTMATAASSASRAALQLAQQVDTSTCAAVRIDVEHSRFLNSSPPAKLELYAGNATAGAALEQLPGDEVAYLRNASQRTATAEGHLGATATLRRRLGLIVSFATKEAWSVDGPQVTGYRDCTVGWQDGNVDVGVAATATTATTVNLRFARLTITTYL